MVFIDEDAKKKQSKKNESKLPVNSDLFIEDKISNKPNNPPNLGQKSKIDISEHLNSLQEYKTP